jgi:hypothetical protein
MKLSDAVAAATEDMGATQARKPCMTMERLFESHGMNAEECDIGEMFVMIVEEPEIFFDDESMPKTWAAAKVKIADAMDNLGMVLDKCASMQEHVVEMVGGKDKYDLVRKTIAYAAIMYKRRYVRDRKTKIAAVAKGMEIDDDDRTPSESGSEGAVTIAPALRAKKTQIADLELRCKQQSETIAMFTGLLRDILANPNDVGSKIAAVLLDMATLT